MRISTGGVGFYENKPSTIDRVPSALFSFSLARDEGDLIYRVIGGRRRRKTVCRLIDSSLNAISIRSQRSFGSPSGCASVR